MKLDKDEAVLVEIHQNFSTDFNASALFAFGSSITPQIYKKCILHVLELDLAYSRIDCLLVIPAQRSLNYTTDVILCLMGISFCLLN